MNYDDYVAAAARENELLLAALKAGPLDVAVPSCPDWVLGDLVVHVGSFMGFWTHVLCDALGREKTPFPDSPAVGEPDALVAWYEDLAEHLDGLLRSTSSDSKVWTWVDYDDSANFVARRCANELAIHRFDAQLSRGAPDPIEAELAADGIDEIFAMVPQREWSGFGSGETLHLHGTDRGDEWMVTLAPDGLVVTREHGKGDLALRGTVSDLELALYKRPPLGAVEHYGDDAVLDAWSTVFTF